MFPILQHHRLALTVGLRAGQLGCNLELVARLVVLRMQVHRVDVEHGSGVLLRGEIGLSDLDATADGGRRGGKPLGRIGELTGRGVALPARGEAALAAVQAARVRIGAAGAEKLRATTPCGLAGATLVQLQRTESILAPGVANLVESTVLEAEHVHRHSGMSIAVREPLEIDVAEIHARRADRVGGHTGDGSPSRDRRHVADRDVSADLAGGATLATGDRFRGHLAKEGR